MTSTIKVEFPIQVEDGETVTVQEWRGVHYIIATKGNVRQVVARLIPAATAQPVRTFAERQRELVRELENAAPPAPTQLQKPKRKAA
jgi:hypothetical protein